MSDFNKTKEEYVEDFAHAYCHDDVEEAKENVIVQEVCKDLESK